MSNAIDQSQKSGDSSVNNQAGRDILIQNGLVYNDVVGVARKEAELVFSQNFLNLAEDAKMIATERADDFLNNFFKKILEQSPSDFGFLRDPGMQLALYTAQKTYATTGDKNLADFLEDILVQRVQNPKRGLLQIVIDECLNVVPKLTLEQFDSLSLIYLIKYTVNSGLRNHKNLAAYFKEDLLPFINGISLEQITYQHLEFASCGSLGLAGVPLTNVFLINYQGLFVNGFTKEMLEERVGPFEKYQEIIGPCLNNTDLFQFLFLNIEELEKIASENKIDHEDVEKIKALQSSITMSDNEVLKLVIKICPEMEDFLEKWKQSSLQRFSLTSVGIALAHANISRKIGRQIDLKKWIK